MDNQFRVWLNFMKWWLLGAFPVMVILFMTLPLVNWTFPADYANEKLIQHYPDQSYICVGINSSSQLVEGNYVEESQRSFIVVPSVFHHQSIVFITKLTKDQKEEIDVSESTTGLNVLIIFFLCSVVGTWKFSIPAFKNLLQK